jgi:hypothetical protein
MSELMQQITLVNESYRIDQRIWSFEAFSAPFECIWKVFIRFGFMRVVGPHCWWLAELQQLKFRRPSKLVQLFNPLFNWHYICTIRYSQLRIVSYKDRNQTWDKTNPSTTSPSKSSTLLNITHDLYLFYYVFSAPNSAFIHFLIQRVAIFGVVRSSFFSWLHMPEAAAWASAST